MADRDKWNDYGFKEEKENGESFYKRRSVCFAEGI